MDKFAKLILGDGIGRTRRSTSVGRFIIAMIVLNFVYWIFRAIVFVSSGNPIIDLSSGDPKLIAGGISQTMVTALLGLVGWAIAAIVYLIITHHLKLQSRWMFAFVVGGLFALVTFLSSILNDHFQPIVLASAAYQFVFFSLWTAFFHFLVFKPAEAEAA